MTTEIRRPAAGAAVLRPEITQALLRAFLAELAAAGYGRLSIEAVARRAGVSKTAVYRRWNSKLDMVLEIVAGIVGRSRPLIDTGSLVGDLEVVLRIVARALRHPLASQIIPDLLTETARNPQLAQVLGDAVRISQRDIVAPLIRRAVDRGELAAAVDPDTAIDLIAGPVYWRLAVARTSLPDAHLSRMAAATAAALVAGSPDAHTATGRDG